MYHFFQKSDFEVSSPEEMMALGERFGREAEAGQVWCLCGDLGAGKTHFVKGFARGVGCVDEASSPSFPLVHEYGGGRLGVYHFDFYRLETPDELITIGWDDYVDAEGIILVEWANKFPEWIPDGARYLNFKVTSPTTRSLSLE